MKQIEVGYRSHEESHIERKKLVLSMFWDSIHLLIGMAFLLHGASIQSWEQFGIGAIIVEQVTGKDSLKELIRRSK